MDGVMHLFPTGVKKVNGGMAWFLRKPCFLLPMYQRCKPWTRWSRKKRRVC